MTIIRQEQPTPRTCGQTVLAMILGRPAIDVVQDMGDRPTSAKDLTAYLSRHGWACRGFLRYTANRERYGPWPHLPPLCLVRVAWSADRKMTHWVLHERDGRFHDPGIGHGAGMAWAATGGRIFSFAVLGRPQVIT